MNKDFGHCGEIHGLQSFSNEKKDDLFLFKSHLCFKIYSSLTRFVLTLILLPHDLRVLLFKPDDIFSCEIVEIFVLFVVSYSYITKFILIYNTS